MSVVSSEEQVIRDYKQTEVGLIPIDWEVKKIGEVSHLSVGGDLDEEKFSEYQDNIYQYPVYSNTVENRGLYGYYKTAEFKGDSVTVVGRGIGIGTAFKRDIEYGAIGRLLVLYPDDKVESNYLTEIINYRLKVFEESSGIPQLTGVSFAGYKIPLPPTKAEQTAIATALSDADALIQSLEKLIAKKRLIKQSAMQELLKPKEGWVVKKLGEMGDIDPENLGNSTDPEYMFNYISLEDVDRGVLKRKNEIKFKDAPSRARRIVRKNDILFSMVRPNLMSHLIVLNNVKDLVCSTGFSVIRCFKDFIPEYVYNLLFSSYVNKQIDALISGSNYPAINSNDVHSLKIPVPSLQEQLHISNVLRDLDIEIGLLESKLEKYKQIKQGMMQNLLTGKIRLV